MRTIRKLCAAILALMLIAMPAMAASVAVVTNANAAVHRSASDQSDAIAVSEGLEMKLTGYESGWGKVKLKGRTGYVRMKYLDLKNPVTAYLSKDATLYVGAGSGSVGTLKRGAKVFFIGIDGDYARVTDGDSGNVGYIALNALTLKKSSASLMATEVDARESKIERAIYVAQNLLGKPYKLLADPPSSFNCAAFVYYCYNMAEPDCVGKNLSEQVHDSRYKKITSISSLKRGDMVCFNIASNTDPYGHVGIYIGEGWFVHASSSDKQVTVSKLTSGYYKKSFSWGRRVLDS